MSESLRQAGSYKLLEFKISDFMGNARTVPISQAENPELVKDQIDAKFHIYQWTIGESLYGNNINGMASVLDAVGLFYDFPLRGEEKLTVKYEDWFGEEREEEFFIHSISDIRPAKIGNSSILAYNLHFVSIGKFISETRMIRRSFGGRISDSVDTVFRDYFKTGPNGTEGTKKNIVIDATIGNQTVIIPNYNGEEAMNFLARRAYGGPDSTSSFMFFETRENYYFRTYENIVESAIARNEEDRSFRPIPTYRWNLLMDDAGIGQYHKMGNILNLNFGNPFSTLSDMNAGAYYKQTFEIDILNLNTRYTNYNHFNRFPRYNELLAKNDQTIVPNHSREFAEKFMTEGQRYLVIQDYPNPSENDRPYVRNRTFYSDLISHKWATAYHHARNGISITVYGRNTLFPGSIVELDLNQFRFQTGNLDHTFSGKYLVDSVMNNFVGDTYTQTLSLHRGGIGSRKEASI